MSRLGEFALRYAALRAMGTKRLQAAKQAALDVRMGEWGIIGVASGWPSPVPWYGARVWYGRESVDEWWFDKPQAARDARYKALVAQLRSPGSAITRIELWEMKGGGGAVSRVELPNGAGGPGTVQIQWR